MNFIKQSYFLLLLVVFFLFIFSSVNLSAEEPTLRQLETAALKYSSLDPDEVSRWKSKAKWAKALPQFLIGYEQRFVNQINNTIQDTISVNSSNINIGPPETQFDENNNFNQGFEVRATWSLDQIAFNRDMLSISSEARYRNIMRNQLLEELHQVYFERKKLKLMQEGKKEEFSQFTRLHLEELEVKLDALTGGYFLKVIHNHPETNQENIYEKQ